VTGHAVALKKMSLEPLAQLSYKNQENLKACQHVNNITIDKPKMTRNSYP
jgi:hypothetical protein